MQNIAIIGAGAWGTALAILNSRSGKNVTLSAREQEVKNTVIQSRENKLFLPGHKLNQLIEVTNDAESACTKADVIMLVIPAQFLREKLKTLSAFINPETPLICCTKGIEQDSSALMTEVVSDFFPVNPTAVLSGPTFASDVASGLPTAVTLASKDPSLAQKLSEQLSSPSFRIYWSDDPIGAQIGGAVKNVLAIACGIIDGRNLGDNARAALITRGLAEMMRLAKVKGAKPETIMGLSGIGDLVLTCSSGKSRNFTLGVALGEGTSLKTILDGKTSIAEGAPTAQSIREMCVKHTLEMPICEAVDNILRYSYDIDTAIREILKRPLIQE